MSLSSPVTARRSARRTIPFPAVLGLVAVGALVAACGSSATTAAGATSSASPHYATGSGQAGAMRVSGAYIPQPANPGVAAAFFTVTDTGAADALTSVSSNVTGDVGLHETVEHGTTGVMVPVARMTVPAHGTLRLQPGGFHVMLMHPSALTVGEQVSLTLHFTHAAPVSLRVPVVPLTADSSMTMGSGS